MRRAAWLAVVLASGCGSASDAPAAAPDGAPAASAPTPDAAPAPAAGVHPVTFRYAPAWDGVTRVVVLGGFGRPDDWMPDRPLLELARGADGVFTGATTLPAGEYVYVFRVQGDAAEGAGLQRYSMDPGNSAFASCPGDSPVAHKMDPPNPCSKLVVPQPPAAPALRVHGTILEDGKPRAGYLVEIHRTEMGTHHFFANRATTGADGSFAFDVAGAGYELHVDHPSLATGGDAGRDPAMLQAARRLLSSRFDLKAPLEVPAVDGAYHEYAQMQPVGAAALPATFRFTVIPGATAARLALYGPVAAGKDVGDPWYTSPYGKATAVTFDGKFDTAHAGEPVAQPGKQYYWGTWQQLGKGGGVVWTLQSLVLPVRF